MITPRARPSLRPSSWRADSARLTGSRAPRWASAVASTPPGATDLGYTDLLDEALAALGPADCALRVRVLARLAENLVLAQPAQARRLADEALATARRLAEPGGLAAALMGRHAALLYAEHAAERRRIGEQLVAVAGELDDRELGALARHWLLYDLAELGDFDDAHRRLQELDAPCRRAPAAAVPALRAGVARRVRGPRRAVRRG